MRRLVLAALATSLVGCTASATGTATVTPGASASPTASKAPTTTGSTAPASSTAPTGTASAAASPAASAAPATTTADKGTFAAESVTLKIDGAATTIDATMGEWSTSNEDSVLSWSVGPIKPMTADGQWAVVTSIANGPRTKKVTAPDFAVADVTERMFQLRRGSGDMMGAVYYVDGSWATSDVTIAGGKVAVTYKGNMKRGMGSGGPATLAVEATLTGLPIPKR